MLELSNIARVGIKLRKKHVQDWKPTRYLLPWLQVCKHSGMNFSIYDLDDRVRQYLNLDNFLSGHTVNDFVEELSKDHTLKGAEVNKLEYLDPKPYIRTFESTLRELNSLSEKASASQQQGEREVDEYEDKHGQTILKLLPEIESTRNDILDLDALISDVTKRISPLGNSLTKITNSRDHSQHTIFLIRAYHGFFTKDKYPPLEEMRVRADFDKKLECAQIVSNLINLASKITSEQSPRTVQCAKIIDKYGETMERTLLDQFETAYDASDFGTMRAIAKILFEYNGGSNVIQTFLSKSDILAAGDHPGSRTSRDASFEEYPEENSMLDDEAIWIKLMDPNYLEPVQEVATQALLDRLRVAIKGQARVVSQVFEDHIPVLRVFIQRVYAQLIQNRISALLQFSMSVGLLAHLRVLYALYTCVGDFTRDVKEFISTNDLDDDNELSSILDQSYYELFIAYTSDVSCINKEKKNLQDIIYDAVQHYNTIHEKAISSELLSSKVDVALSGVPRDQTALEMEYQPQSSTLLESRHLKRFKSYMKSTLSEHRRYSGELDNNSHLSKIGLEIQVVETVLKLCIESVARLLELWPTKAPEFSLDVLEILLYDFGKFYLGAGLEVAYDVLRQENIGFKISSGQQINYEYLSILRSASNILFLMTSTIKKTLIPCAVNSPDIKGRMGVITNNFVARCEKSLNIILFETNTLIAQRTVNILSKQRKKDFICDVIEEDTEACELLSSFMTEVHQQFTKMLDGPNLTTILIKVGMQFLSQLLDHYKKFTVNSTGGIVLTKDVIRYQSVIDEWGIPELSESFQLLREIGNLFTVQSELINSLVSEGQLANLKQFTVRQYVSKRADFNPSYLERLFSFN